MTEIRRVPPSEAPKIDKIRVMRNLCEQKGLEKHLLVINLGWYLALRAKEICGLRFNDFNHIDREVFIRLEIAKGKSEGYVPIKDQSFLDEIEAYKSKKGYFEQDFVLNYSASKKGYTTRQIHRMAKKVGELVGFPGFYTHMLRHSRARWLLENGYNYKYVQKYLRHADPLTTLRMYAHFDKSSMRLQTDNGKEVRW